jgi:hypothetical protein
VKVVQELQTFVSKFSKTMVLLEANTQQAAASISKPALATRAAEKSSAATAAGAVTEEFMVDTKGLGRPPIVDPRMSDGIPNRISAVDQEGLQSGGFSEALCQGRHQLVLVGGFGDFNARHYSQFSDLDPDSVEAASLQLSILLCATTEDEAFDIVDGPLVFGRSRSEALMHGPRRRLAMSR